MEKRNDGTEGKTAAEWIAEDADRDNRSNKESYNPPTDYEGDDGDLDDENGDDVNFDDPDNVSAD